MVRLCSRIVYPYRSACRPMSGAGGRKERRSFASRLRRNARLRKEYLYRRSLVGKDQQDYEKKKLIREAIEKGTPLPNALRDVAADLLEEAEFEEDVMNKRDAQGRPLAAPKSRIIPKSLSLQGASSDLIVDSEYATAGYSDPYIMVTTSRDPSSRLTQFAKELKLIFPNSIRINRGNHVLGQLTTACRQQNATDLVLVHETRGIPDGLIISHMPYGPTAYFALLNVVLRHEIDDIGTVSQANPHLILNNFTTKLGERVTHILKHLFPPAKDDSQRVVTFANDNDFISFRHHVYKKSGGKNVEITEAGPRFELQLYQIKLGTVEMTEAENEWVLRPYMNSAKKRHAL